MPEHCLVGLLTTQPALPPDLKQRRDAEKLITNWAQDLVESDTPVASVERGEAKGDISGWYMRLEGEQKQYFSIWFELGQRTLKYESYFMPAPLENADQLYAYLLSHNYRLYGAAFSIGPENAVYLSGRIAIPEITAEELDRILGTIYSGTERHFRPAMRLGFGSKFKG